MYKHRDYTGLSLLSVTSEIILHSLWCNILIVILGIKLGVNLEVELGVKPGAKFCIGSKTGPF